MTYKNSLLLLYLNYGNPEILVVLLRPSNTNILGEPSKVFSLLDLNFLYTLRGILMVLTYFCSKGTRFPEPPNTHPICFIPRRKKG